MKRLLQENPNSAKYWNKVFDSEIKNNINRFCIARLNMVDAHIKDGTSILDIGCGKGEFLLEMAKRKLNLLLHGCDISEVAIKNCKNKMLNGKFITCDIKDLKKHYKENYFNYIICEEVIEHIDNPEKLIKDVYSMLKQGGKFILSTPYKNKIGGEHIWSFNIKDFVYIFENNKWEIEQIIRYYDLRNLFISVIKK